MTTNDKLRAALMGWLEPIKVFPNARDIKQLLDLFAAQGLAIVPVEPTEEDLDKACRAVPPGADVMSREGQKKIALIIYKAIIGEGSV